MFAGYKLPMRMKPLADFFVNNKTAFMPKKCTNSCIIAI